MPSKKKPSILIFDPDIGLTGILTRRLEANGWIVRTAKKIDQVKKACAKTNFKIILMDLLHEDDTTEAIKEIAEITKGISVIVMHTKSMSREDVQDWKELGVKEIWLKGHWAFSDIIKKIKKFAN